MDDNVIMVYLATIILIILYALVFKIRGMSLQSTTTRLSESAKLNSSREPGPDFTTHVHFLFLAHGLKGLAGDLKYLQSSIQDAFERRSAVGGQDSILISHIARCNERKTYDGIERGGERLAEEILTVMKQQIDLLPEKCFINNSDNNQQLSITLSLIGNSLGGLYARYAISLLCLRFGNSNKLNQNGDDEENYHLIIDGHKVHLNVFVTTVTPHLGVSEHTFLTIPRILEKSIGYVIGQTGRDLFQFNNLIVDMATSDLYLKPLESFKRRVAFANAYQTDFMVPHETAAFLSESSQYPHIYVTSHYSEGNEMQKKWSVVKYKTESIKSIDVEKETWLRPRKIIKGSKKSHDKFHKMSVRLDSLGWEKSFVDLREMVLFQQPDRNDRPLASKQESVMSSSDLISHLKKKDSFFTCFPTGHDVIISNQRNEFRAFLNRGGQGVMDVLAEDLVQSFVS